MKIIGFIPTFNVLSQGYPFLEAIYSHLNVCDDIYILDASTDFTKRILKKSQIITYIYTIQLCI